MRIGNLMQTRRCKEYVDKLRGVFVTRWNHQDGQVTIDVKTQKGSFHNLDLGEAGSLLALLVDAMMDAGHDFEVKDGWPIGKGEA